MHETAQLQRGPRLGCINEASGAWRF